MKYLTSLIFFIIVNICHSQNSTLKQEKTEEVNSSPAFGLKLEYSHQHTRFLNIGVSYLNPNIIETACATYVIGLRGFSISSDISLKSDNTIYVPKVSCEATYMFFTAKINTGLATNGNQKEFIFSPEVGLSAYGFVYFLYG